MVSDGTDKYAMGTGGLFTPECLEQTDLRTFDAVSQFIAKNMCDVPPYINPTCIETGSMYTWDPEVPCWNTTTSLFERLCRPFGGHLYTIDHEPNVELINKALCSLKDEGELCLNATIVMSHSVEGIKLVLNTYHKHKVDLLCLDSGEDPDLMVAEYEAAKDRLAEKHYVLVDDIHNANSVKYLKMVPLLKELGYDWVQVPTHTGLFVAAKGYPVPRK